MRVLIISHTALDRSTNMGKTLSSYFSGFSPQELAQFYIHNQLPEEDSLCRNFYRFTDKDALRSLLVPRGGRVYAGTEGKSTSLWLRWMYRLGRRRTAGIYLLRNLLWRLSHWDTGCFRQWVDAFSPDVIFLVSGDYGFLYEIARGVQRRTGKPLVVSCVDDYYFHNRNAGSLLGRLVYRAFLRTVEETMAGASAAFCICPAMRECYERRFGIPCHCLPTAAEDWGLPAGEEERLSYMGNLDNGRHLTLRDMGRALRRIWEPGLPACIDVYSGERDPAVLKELTPENGIRFHGKVSCERVREIMAQSLAVIHAESFEPQMQARVRLSVSTKIPESLRNGPCIIACGPEGAASISYLKENGAGYVISRPGELEQGLKEILSDRELRLRVIAKARNLARQNHDVGANSQNLRTWLEAACREKEESP